MIEITIIKLICIVFVSMAIGALLMWRVLMPRIKRRKGK